jgi:hypothetical protein
MNWKQIAAALASMALTTTPVFASQGGAGGGGGGAGGGAAAPPIANPLPATTPALGVLFRESFGPGADLVLARPTGGNGKLRSVIAGTSLGGFWVEWPGSKSNTWSAANGAWVFAFASLDPFEVLPTPIQPLPFNGIAFSDWADGVVTTFDAIAPFRGAATAYTVSADVFPAFLGGSYVGIGLTSSGGLNQNLQVSGQIWLKLAQIAPFDGTIARYDVMVGNTSLASGRVALDGFNAVEITVNPVAGTVSAVLNGATLGSWTTRVTPSFIAIEGQGWADNIVVQTVP